METQTVSVLHAGTYGIDPVHSSLGFAVKFNGLSMFRSSFNAVEGALNDGVLAGAVPVESLGIQMPRFREHLLTADFFDAEHFPQMTFTSTSIDVSPDSDDVTVSGDLSIRGISRPVSASGTYGAAEDPFGNDRIGMSLTATIDRREFGLTWQNPLPGGGDALGWHVVIEVELQLVKPHN